MKKKKISKKDGSRSIKIVSHMDRLRTLLKALPELYPKDPCAPGVVLAWLPDSPNLGSVLPTGPLGIKTSYRPTGVFYGSIARYDLPAGQAKQILVSAKGPELEMVIHELIDTWHRRTINARRLYTLSKWLK